MIYTIQLRRDLAANWTARNHVLHDGELGIEDDTKLVKLGDGLTAWNSLPYWATSGILHGMTSPAIVPLVDAPTITVDASKGNDFRGTLGASRVIGAPLNPADGQPIIFHLTQGGAGTCLVTWNAVFNFGSSGPPILSTLVGETDMVGFKYRADKTQWWYTGSMLGF